MHTHALTHVCTQVAPTPIVTDAAFLGSTMLSNDDFDLLEANPDLKWAPAINKKTKNKLKKKAHKQKKQKNARAHTKTHAHMYSSCCIRWNFL